MPKRTKRSVWDQITAQLSGCATAVVRYDPNHFISVGEQRMKTESLYCESFKTGREYEVYGLKSTH